MAPPTNRKGSWLPLSPPRRAPVGRTPTGTSLLVVVTLAGCASTPSLPDESLTTSEQTAPTVESGPTAIEVDSSAYTGGLTLVFENDIFLGHDSRFTAAAALAWTSAELSSYAEGNFQRKVGDALGFLPKVGDPGYGRYLLFKLGGEMYTPRDIESSEPPPGDHPYAGVVALDSSIFARGDVSQHQYTLRLGMVGPSSGAEELQRFIHEITGSSIPQGWDTQLSDEPLLNGYYQYNRRLYRHDVSETTAGDVSVNGGGGFGNYYIGGNAGLNLRFGLRLPDAYGVTPLLGGMEPLVGVGPSKEFHGHVFLGLQGFGVAHFLPTDGNTFQESRSGERDDWLATASAGLMLGYGHFVLTYTVNGVFGLSSSEGFQRHSDNDFGTFTFSWIFG